MPRSKTNVLLAEGLDDTHVLIHLCRHFEFPEYTFHCESTDGYQALRHDIQAYILGSETQRIGLIFDANQSPRDRWQSITSRLRELGYGSMPDVPQAEGTVIPPDGTPTGRPALGLWMWPDNIGAGILEDFASEMVRQTDPLWALAREAVDAIPQDRRKFKPLYLSKAYVHTWLAWQEEPGSRMGQAVTNRYFDADVPIAQSLKQWLNRLLAQSTQ